MATAAMEAPTTPMVTATSAFEISIDRAELVKQIAAARAVVTNKITIPVLGNLLMQAKDGALTITASDLDTTVQTACQAKVIQPGACTVPARKFYDYIRLLPDGRGEDHPQGEPLDPCALRPELYEDGWPAVCELPGHPNGRR